MMTLEAEKEVFLVAGAFDVFKVFVFQKWFTFYLSLLGQVLSSICNESGHFRLATSHCENAKASEFNLHIARKESDVT